MHFNVGIDALDYFVNPGLACDNQVLPCANFCGYRFDRIYQCRSQIAPAEILGEGVFDIPLYGLIEARQIVDQRKKPPWP